VRGISHHAGFRSIYLRDPDGYVVELAAAAEDGVPPQAPANARRTLDGWQRRKAEAHAITSLQLRDAPCARALKA
jgi:hypothetical protein